MSDNLPPLPSESNKLPPPFPGPKIPPPPLASSHTTRNILLGCGLALLIGIGLCVLICISVCSQLGNMH